MLDVIGAGFGRTGTLSLKLALEQLGFNPCYHMSEVAAPRPGYNDGHLNAWHDFAVTGKAMDWRWLLKGYRACVDFPTCIYYRELMEVFPRARVVLTTRDPDRWFKSWATLWSAVDVVNDSARVIHAQKFFPFVEALLRKKRFGGEIERQSSIAAFNAHIEQVKSAVPAERLLVFNVEQGWRPLCKFLAVGIPDGPFPHANEGDGMLDKLKLGFWGTR